MKNIKFFPLTCLAATAFLTTAFTVIKLGVTNAKVDTQNSIVIWTGYKKTGKHVGTVNVKSGSLQLTDDRLTGGSFEIDMNSIKNTDLDGEFAQKLVGQLKSDEFFGVAQHPVARFVITRIIPQGSKDYKIIGNITIKETTKEVKFFGNVTSSGNQVNATGKMTIDRSEFNVHFGSGSFFDGLGDKAIYDEFDLEIKLVATKE